MPKFDPQITRCLCGTDAPAWLHGHPIAECTVARALLTDAEWVALAFFGERQTEIMAARMEDKPDISTEELERGMVLFYDAENGYNVQEPMRDLTLAVRVNPVHEYGEAFLASPYPEIARALVAFKALGV
jgi:hypothetical protein